MGEAHKIPTKNGAETPSTQPNENDAMLRRFQMQFNQMRETIAQMDAMLRDKTIDHLFKVLKYGHLFDDDIVEKSVKAISTYLSSIAFGEDAKETPAENPAETPNGSKEGE